MRSLFLAASERLPSGLLELTSLLLVYTLFKGSLFYLFEIIGNYIFLFSDSLRKQFHSDQEVLLQGISIFASFWMVRSYFRYLKPESNSETLRGLLLRRQAGLHTGRLVAILCDGLLKGLLIASLFLGMTTLIGLTQFEMAVLLDLRGVFTVLPVQIGQFLSFLVWVASLEILRRYLHQVLVIHSSTPMLGLMMTICSEAYLLYQVFLKPEQVPYQSILLALSCMVLASAQLLWCRLTSGLPVKQEVRISMLRFGMSFGFWASLLFVFGWSVGSFKATSFVNLFPVNPQSHFAEFFAANGVPFLILVIWSFTFSANLVLGRLVRSVFRNSQLSQLTSPRKPSTLDVEELQFQD